MENFWKENLGIFHNVKKIEIYFPRNTFVNKEFFFQEYLEMELKIFLIIFEGFLEWQN